jgi:hypothetical protein
MMPEILYKQVPYPNRQERWLDEAAAKGQLIVCRCRRCRRLVRYLAADLLPILGPMHRAEIDAPFACAGCGKRDAIIVKLDTPSAGDVGSLEVRRPSGIKQIQMWRTVKLGDEVRNTLHVLPDLSDPSVALRSKNPPQRGDPE